ncbi:hypothetical protein BVRB_5g124110 [Beta vulgaris subsp. vulgaris]|uniref:Uncharacterized protein n=1 Tax=Beta vulgaris subsp. vulgaris TaxID=3555 RepID=A0A0J8B9V1_BETVV|nr:hypothetical protein BVRB_5g124110 [Beta vulgaris subsp. vulgaris]
MCYDKMMVVFDPICLKAAHFGEVDVVVEALKLLDDRIDERRVLKNTSNGPKEGTPSSVGNNTIRQDVTHGSVNLQEGPKDPLGRHVKDRALLDSLHALRRGKDPKNRSKGTKMARN